MIPNLTTLDCECKTSKGSCSLHAPCNDLSETARLIGYVINYFADYADWSTADFINELSRVLNIKEAKSGILSTTSAVTTKILPRVWLFSPPLSHLSDPPTLNFYTRIILQASLPALLSPCSSTTKRMIKCSP